MGTKHLIVGLMCLMFTINSCAQKNDTKKRRRYGI